MLKQVDIGIFIWIFISKKIQMKDTIKWLCKCLEVKENKMIYKYVSICEILCGFLLQSFLCLNVLVIFM